MKESSDKYTTQNINLEVDKSKVEFKTETDLIKLMKITWRDKHQNCAIMLQQMKIICILVDTDGIKVKDKLMDTLEFVSMLTTCFFGRL